MKQWVRFARVARKHGDTGPWLQRQLPGRAVRRCSRPAVPGRDRGEAAIPFAFAIRDAAAATGREISEFGTPLGRVVPILGGRNRRSFSCRRFRKRPVGSWEGRRGICVSPESLGHPALSGREEPHQPVTLPFSVKWKGSAPELQQVLREFPRSCSKAFAPIGTHCCGPCRHDAPIPPG